MCLEFLLTCFCFVLIEIIFIFDLFYKWMPESTRVINVFYLFYFVVVVADFIDWLIDWLTLFLFRKQSFEIIYFITIIALWWDAVFFKENQENRALFSFRRKFDEKNPTSFKGNKQRSKLRITILIRIELRHVHRSQSNNHNVILFILYLVVFLWI